jgi:hypothetical protein
MASVAARGAATLSDEICRTILPMNMMMRSVIQILKNMPARCRRQDRVSPDRARKKTLVAYLF